MNIFRNEYRPLSRDEADTIKAIKEKAAELYDLMALMSIESGPEAIHKIPTVVCDQRMIALAKTNLEQSVMWATKAITG